MAPYLQISADENSKPKSLPKPQSKTKLPILKTLLMNDTLNTNNARIHKKESPVDQVFHDAGL